MPKVKQRTPSRGEIHELKRLQAIYQERLRKLPVGSNLPTIYRPARMDRVT